MNVSAIPSSNIFFGTNERFYYVGPLKTEVLNLTSVNRDDLDFKSLAKYILNKYKHEPKVNIYNLACSDGSEPYTLIMHLLENDKNNNARKFFPLVCSDLEPHIISCAKSGMLNMNRLDIESLSNDGIDYKKYFAPSKNKRFIINDKKDLAVNPLPENITKTYEVRDVLKNNTIFSRKTILQQVDEITNDVPNIVLCRNVLPYCGNSEDILYHLNSISKKLVKDDILVLGDYDLGIIESRFLKLKGFEKIMKNVYLKIR